MEGDCSHEIQRHLLAPWKESYDKPRKHIKKQRHHFADKHAYSQNYDFSSSHIWMWELDHKKYWTPKTWCFWTVVLEKTPESPLDCNIKPVHPKGNQPWILIRRTMLKLKFQSFGHLMLRADSLEKILMLEKTEGKRKKGQQRMRWLYRITDSMDMNLSKSKRQWRAEQPGVLKSVGSAKNWTLLMTEQQHISITLTTQYNSHSKVSGDSLTEGPIHIYLLNYLD